ncbi:uncharacterized protein CG1552 isoform X2 [Drosophila guanche]|uniref:Blast:Uncharacterized protein CG1552 n=1 Tax=Drosophila guanche TaxID=7266 RepID=A0A3B0KAM5_DROGU|nr:uncharacterized protein CG1552 isoform X2 [Drosophila guanche]SPP89772.1 blast:Uncharacterized protein CG1552 [Drosophila guanche]
MYKLKKLWVLMCLALVGCQGFGQFHMKHYQLQRNYIAQEDSGENDNSVLRTFRRCMWEQSKFLPRRLVLLSLCSNLFCENNHIIPRSSCLDILTDQCEQGNEEELMYKPFPDCCPVYCNLKRRMQRLRTMHLRHRVLRNMQEGSTSGAAGGGGSGGDGPVNSLLSEFVYNNY